MKKKKIKPVKGYNVVCASCGLTANYLTCMKKYGAPPLSPAFTVSTYYPGKCDYCGRHTDVTQVRDFYYPDFSLIDIAVKAINTEETVEE